MNKVYIVLFATLVVGLLYIALLEQRGSSNYNTFYDWGNDTKVEATTLIDHRLIVRNDARILFRSEGTWNVRNFLIGDFNNDGVDELGIGFFRKGDYGADLEFLKPRRGENDSFHLFLYQYSAVENKFKLIWGSSTLPHPMSNMELIKLDDTNVLKVAEGSYEEWDESQNLAAQKISFWIWNEWWFEEYIPK